MEDIWNKWISQLQIIHHWKTIAVMKIKYQLYIWVIIIKIHWSFALSRDMCSPVKKKNAEPFRIMVDIQENFEFFSFLKDDHGLLK